MRRFSLPQRIGMVATAILIAAAAGFLSLRLKPSLTPHPPTPSATADTVAAPVDTVIPAKPKPKPKRNRKTKKSPDFRSGRDEQVT